MSVILSCHIPWFAGCQGFLRVSQTSGARYPEVATSLWISKSLKMCGQPANELLTVAQERNRNRKPEQSEPFFLKNRTRNWNRRNRFQELKPEPEPSFPVKLYWQTSEPFLQRNRRNWKPEPLELFHPREEHSVDQYRLRLKLSENFEWHWSMLISGEIHMDQSLLHNFSWGNSYGPMLLKVLLKFPPALVLVHGWLFPAPPNRNPRERNRGLPDCCTLEWQSRRCTNTRSPWRP